MTNVPQFAAGVEVDRHVASVFVVQQIKIKRSLEHIIPKLVQLCAHHLFTY